MIESWRAKRHRLYARALSQARLIEDPNAITRGSEEELALLVELDEEAGA